MGHGKSKLSRRHHSHSSSSSFSATTKTTTTTTDEQQTSTTTKAEGGWSRRKAEELFARYSGGSNRDTLGPDECEQLCADLRVAPEDAAVLVLAWHMRARVMGFFTRAEFVEGLRSLRVDSLPQLRARVAAMRAELAEPAVLRDVFRFAFLYSRESPDAKTIDLATADALLALLCPEARFVPAFREFLRAGGTAARGINLDQWTSLLDFSETVSAQEDLAGYDPDGAWPVLIDEFVAWYREKTLLLPHHC